MSKVIGSILFCVMIAGFGTISNAAGNAGAGRTKSAACAGCHGPDGNSPVATFPRTAGQHAKYLKRQLSDFKNMKRDDPTMLAMVAALSEDDMEDLAAFYAGQKPKYPPKEDERYLDEDEEIPVTAEMISAGKSLYMAGSETKGIAACSACHGRIGDGNRPAGFPVLKGQFLSYLIKSLTDFKEGLRANDDGATMRSIAGKMSQADINAVSAYLSGLR